MAEFENPYLEEARSLGLPLDGRPAPRSKSKAIDGLVHRYGLPIVTPKALQPFVDLIDACNIPGIIGIGSGDAYAESRIAQWFHKEVYCSDLKPKSGTPVTTWNQRVHKADHRITTKHGKDALFLSFPTHFGLECLKLYHQGGGRAVCYVGTLANPRAGKEFFDYLAAHSALPEKRRSRRSQQLSRSQKAGKKVKTQNAPRLPTFNSIAQTFIPTIIESPDGTCEDTGSQSTLPGGKLKAKLKRGRSRVTGIAVSRANNRDVVQVHLLRPLE